MGIRKAYYYLFYKLNSFFENVSDDGFADWKAGLIVQTLEIFVFLTVGGWYAIFTKKNILPDNPFWIVLPIAIGLALLNYFTFLHHDRWKKYEEEFKKQPKKKRTMGSWMVFLFILLVISSMIFMFYNLSQIDWAALAGKE